MKEALDLRSKSGIHRLITALEERGFIRRLPHRARALEIIKLPDAMTDGDAPVSGTGLSRWPPRGVLPGRVIWPRRRPPSLQPPRVWRCR